MKKTDTPLVSVVMPVYNAGRFLKQAIDSILGQTYTNFELIAINDGSTDGSGDLLDHYATVDPRVIVIHQKNTGIVGALNAGIKLSRGKYIARQDSDDVSFQQRLERQVKALESNKQIVLVTGGFEVFNEDDEFLYREVLPANDDDIKRAMYLRNPIGHGSVMFLKSACVEAGLYNGECGPIEDFELWTRLARKGEFLALESSMFHWRVNPNGITTTKNEMQRSLMSEQMKKIWAAQRPKVISSRELRQRGNAYRKQCPVRGVAMKENMLADNAQLAVKMLRYGFPFAGLRQMIAVALVGRSGFKAVYHRFRELRRGSLQAIRRWSTYSR